MYDWVTFIVEVIREWGGVSCEHIEIVQRIVAQRGSISAKLHVLAWSQGQHARKQLAC